MKALILCAGKGTRLRPLTFTNAKPLIPIANKPTIMYSLEKIRDAGVTEIGLVVNSENIEDFKKVLGDGSQLGIKLSYIIQEHPKGLAHAVKVSKEFLGNDDFIMYLGDNLINFDLKNFIDQFKQGNYESFILLTSVDNPSQFGIAVMEDSKVTKVVEKPKDAPSNLAIIGVYIFTPKVFEAIQNIQPSWRGELEITDAIQWLIDNSKNVGAHIVEGWWKDTGKPEDLIEANRTILSTLKERKIEGEIRSDSSVQGMVHMGKNTKIMNSIIRGPVIIGEDVTISNAYIGPYTSIGDSAYINSSEIENSIILSYANISNVYIRIESSIIGENSKIYSTERKPYSLKLVIGDYSNIQIPK
ncbi:glucose-1-phosphate thymidylyltransferase [Petrotoga sibirica]|uniref:Glucose-1-phosphate thymidylyltransferase n=2 Tax=Petrotoga sibirica TaxID=156202 RepID=A0A4R8EZ19_9BACT|nr:glucose-1-phosphate thymidylyltransferase [Petrotoga sibirica]POZ87941.1 glucose-1-phosphate thymidylyltransferase [Petrotoga sibirica DSM 13575]TDX16098.1 glucose-1-phosphate thymidylyltransferase [Petrotoga sibirica]